MFGEFLKRRKRIGNPAAASCPDYCVYTTEFDRIIHGDDLPALFSPEQEAAFQARVAEVDPVLSQWRTAAELVAIDDVKAYAAKHSADDPNDTVACLLVDHSGSLRGQPAVLTTAVAEVAADYWSRIGVRYEILGFTTLTWRGGRSREKWMNSGHPRNPGRLCDLLHIIYRTADAEYEGPPPSVRSLLREALLKENVDGEALAWAAARLRDRPETRKILIVVSDGGPVDDSTLLVNPGDCLHRHLKKVIASINEAGDLWLAGIGIGRDVSTYYARHLSIASTDEPSQVVKFIADCTDVPLAPGPLRESGLPEPDEDPPPPGTKLTISGSFLALVAALLSLAAIIVMLPGSGRLTVFPFVVAGWLVSVCLHEFAHAVAAYGSGDLTVRDKGYLTLDPLRYTNLQFSILWPLIVLAIGGIGLPGGAVYVNTWALRSLAHRTLVYAAGPFATLSVLILLSVLLRADLETPLYEAVAFLALLQLTALVLNLFPAPGLDGWGIVEPWLPGALREMGMRFAGAAPALLLLFLFIPGVNKLFWRLVLGLCWIIGLDVDAALDGLELFQFWH